MAARNWSYILARIKVEVDVSYVSVVEDEGTPGLKTATWRRSWRTQSEKG